jgi:hypothetical protein
LAPSQASNKSKSGFSEHERRGPRLPDRRLSVQIPAAARLPCFGG